MALLSGLTSPLPHRIKIFEPERGNFAIHTGVGEGSLCYTTSMANALTTKARVKDRIKITTTNHDDLIDNLILAVTARLEVMCNRQFTLATYTNELHDGSDWYGSARTIIIPKNAPLATVSSVQYKAGTNSTPLWTDFNSDTYDIDYDTGMIYFDTPVPRGRRNIRITYTAGWSGYDVELSELWTFNVTPTGTVNGSNDTFTLPEDAKEVIVYADGVRVKAASVTHTEGSDTFTLAAGAVPYSTIAADYKAGASEAGSDPTLPMELVDLCERVVVYLFKKRESEGKTSESFQESSITWRDNMFTPDMRATIKNYRRGYEL